MKDGNDAICFDSQSTVGVDFTTIIKSRVKKMSKIMKKIQIMSHSQALKSRVTMLASKMIMSCV